MLKPGELVQIPKGTKILSLTLMFNYKRRKYGTIEERKTRASIRGYQMKSRVYFDPACTSAPMVDRMVARMFVSLGVERVLVLEHLDVPSAFSHDG